MSDINETIYYKELQAGDAVHDGDQFRDVDGQWKPYIFKAHMGGKVAFGVTARRPIRATHQTTFEEVAGSRTLQQAVEQPQRVRWAYEELRPGDLIQEGDEWQNPDGRWHPLVLTPGASMEVRDVLRARRPHNITALQKERDEARAQGAKLSAELWARNPLEDRVAALTDEVAQLREERQEWIDRRNDESVRALRLSEQLSAAEVGVKSAQRARDELQLQVDELRADRERLQGLIDNLLDEPTAKQVYSMLEDMLDQTEWVGQCLDSSTFEQMSCIQRTISVIAERVSEMGKEATSADA